MTVLRAFRGQKTEMPVFTGKSDFSGKIPLPEMPSVMPEMPVLYAEMPAPGLCPKCCALCRDDHCTTRDALVTAVLLTMVLHVL